MHDNLGLRMKQQYEDRTRYFLPRRTYTIIRVDGKAFHTYLRHCQKPFDLSVMNAMDQTALYMCENIQGAKFAYVQSDEISILLTDFEKIQTNAWFDGNIQKIVSVSASLATAQLNVFNFDCNRPGLAHFDSRVFTIPDHIEVENYFIWRQNDATRNSVQMAAQSLYNHKELNHKNNSELQEMIFQKGVNWNDYPTGFKRGRIITKDLIKSEWKIDIEPPIFTQEKEYLRKKIPIIWENKDDNA